MYTDALTICSRCNGWGLIPQPLTNKSTVCDLCNGNSTSLETANLKVIWDMPTFVNYQERNKSFFKKLTIFIVILASFIGVISLLIYLLQLTINSL